MEHINPQLTPFVIDANLDQIQDLFRPGVKLTLIVRDPAGRGVAIVYGNDEAMRRVLAKYFASIGVRLNG